MTRWQEWRAQWALVRTTFAFARTIMHIRKITPHRIEIRQRTIAWVEEGTRILGALQLDIDGQAVTRQIEEIKKRAQDLQR